MVTYHLLSSNQKRVPQTSLMAVHHPNLAVVIQFLRVLSSCSSGGAWFRTSRSSLAATVVQDILQHQLATRRCIAMCAHGNLPVVAESLQCSLAARLVYFAVLLGLQHSTLHLFYNTATAAMVQHLVVLLVVLCPPDINCCQLCC